MMEDDTAEGSVSSIILGSMGSMKNDYTISQQDMNWADSYASSSTSISVNNDVSEQIPVPSFYLGSLGPTRHEDIISDEDLAWVDSCFIKDPPDSSESVVDITYYQTDPIVKRDDSLQETDIEISEEQVEEEKVEEMNAFSATYRGEMQGVDDSDSDSELSYPTFVTEVSSTEDIFKIWDLEIPRDDDNDEENDDDDDDDDELIKKLKKALSQSFLKPIPYTYDDSGVWKDLKNASLDDLVGGIEGLSLSKKSG